MKILVGVCKLLSVEPKKGFMERSSSHNPNNFDTVL